MRLQDIRLMYDYNAWANARILDAAEGVPPEQLATAALGACKLLDTLQHILVAEVVWRQRWQGIQPQPAQLPPAPQALAELRAQWRAEQAELDAFLAALTDADLDRPLTYLHRSGGTYTRTLWHTLLHVVNHGTQHRAEAALLLTELGRSPGDVDMTVFLQGQARG